MGKWFKTTLAVGLMGMMILPAFAATKAPAKKTTKAPVKKTTSQPAVMSATQLKGGPADFGREYTIGKSSPVNFILNSAEYTLGRIHCGASIMTPNADEKLLVLKFTLRNPRPTEIDVNWDSPLTFTVVDDNNSNHDCEGCISTGVNGDALNVTLKPAQKYDAYATIKVPATTDIPKLIVKSQDDLVLRYDLREKIKGLSAPFIDPEAKKKGVVALEEVPGEMGTYYVICEWNVQINGASFSTEKIKDHDLEEGCKYLVVHATFKNGTKTEQPLSWGTFEPKITTEDGDNIDYQSLMLYGKRNEYVNTELKPDQELKARFFFQISEDVKPKTFSINLNSSHTYLFDVSNAQ